MVPRIVRPNPYHVAGARNAEAEELEACLVRRAICLGFDLQEEDTLKVVRHLVFGDKFGKGTTWPNHADVMRDVMHQCLPACPGWVEVLKRARALLKQASRIKTPQFQDVEAVSRAYDKWAASLAPVKGQINSIKGKEGQLASALRRLMAEFEVSIEEIKQEGEVDKNSSHSPLGSILRKAVRASIGVALGKDTAGVSAVIKNTLSTTEKWEKLLEEDAEHDWIEGLGKTTHSFGNVRSNRAGITTYWGGRLTEWIESYVGAQPADFNMDTIYQALAAESEHDPDSIRTLRGDLFAHLHAQARAENYPSLSRLHRNIRRACDPAMGNLYRRDLSDEDEDVLVRCLYEDGFSNKAYVAASSELGLSVAKIYEWVTKKTDNLEKLQARVNAYGNA